MEFDNDRVDVGGLDDRRGMGGGGLAIGGGAGVVGLIVYVLVQLLGGGNVDLSQITPAQTGSSSRQESTAELEKRCNSDGALDKYVDCRMIKVYNVADDVWSEEFSRRGLSYEPPRLVFFENGVNTGCGQASSQVGPFYCPPDEKIYLDLGFLEQLQQQFGAEGTFAQAYIEAHEYGHHLQTLLGTERKVRSAQQSDPDNANRYSVAMELQADCYAGAWATLADKDSDNGIALTKDNIAEAVNAAEAVGDDRIQKKAQGRVDPESWTHGSAAQRAQWFTTGYTSGDIDSCNTFASV
ncbi:KPN_02809 family neutral zinc metallopeptidase [Spongisporangium articulatum]